MNGNPGNGREELSMAWVKKQLKAISAVEPPATLRDRLEAGLPATIEGPIMHRIRRGAGGIRWAAAAAVVFLGVSAAVWFGAPWGRRTPAIADANSSSGRVYATDHNGPRPVDTNLCDFNSLR